MRKVLMLLPLLFAALSIRASFAAPSLFCVPDINRVHSDLGLDVEPQVQTTRRKVLIYYLNGNKQWPAEVDTYGNRVKAIIFKMGDSRPMKKSIIDVNGHGVGQDYRGFIWEFRGFLK